MTGRTNIPRTPAIGLMNLEKDSPATISREGSDKIYELVGLDTVKPATALRERLRRKTAKEEGLRICCDQSNIGPVESPLLGEHG